MTVSTGVNVEGLRKARIVVISGVIFLLLVICAYALLHNHKIAPSYKEKNADLFFEKMGKVKAVIVKPRVVPREVTGALAELAGVENDELTGEVSEDISFLKGFAKTLEGETAVAQNDKRIADIRDRMERIEKEAAWLTGNDGFFWVTGFWKWLEIVFWGEFGVLTGILVWVCTQVKEKKYSEEMYESEKYWYLTEVVIGPVVVVAVFFLLKQFIGTLLDGVTEQDVKGSIYMTLGVSFALGLYLRRTLGVFGFIKDRLPLPGKEENGDSGQAGGKGG